MTTPASPPILLIDGHVATVRLNRPEHRNRLEPNDLQVLMAHFACLEQNSDVRVVVLTANTQGQSRPVFCAGYDIRGFDQAHGENVAFETVVDALENLRPVTVCALNGSVYGGATDLALACDFRIGLQDLQFRMPAVALGLHYYPSGLRRYVARLGVAATKLAFLTARPWTAEQLRDAGGLDLLVSADDFQTQLSALVRDVASLAPLALESTKQTINEIAQGCWDLEAIRAREALTQQSRDFAEGRLAFSEKRAPRFVRG